MILSKVFGKSFTEAVELLKEKNGRTAAGRPSSRPSPTSGYRPAAPNNRLRGTMEPAALMSRFFFASGDLYETQPKTTPYLVNRKKSTTRYAHRQRTAEYSALM